MSELGEAAPPRLSAADATARQTYKEIVDDVRTHLRLADVGKATGVSHRQAANWAAGLNSPQGNARDRLLRLHFILGELEMVFTREGIDIWLHRPEARLGGVAPVSALRAGELERVGDLVSAMVRAPAARGSE